MNESSNFHYNKPKLDKDNIQYTKSFKQNFLETKTLSEFPSIQIQHKFDRNHKVSRNNKDYKSELEPIQGTTTQNLKSLFESITPRKNFKLSKRYENFDKIGKHGLNSSLMNQRKTEYGIFTEGNIFDSTDTSNQDKTKKKKKKLAKMSPIRQIGNNKLLMRVDMVLPLNLMSSTSMNTNTSKKNKKSPRKEKEEFCNSSQFDNGNDYNNHSSFLKENLFPVPKIKDRKTPDIYNKSKRGFSYSPFEYKNKTHSENSNISFNFITQNKKKDAYLNPNFSSIFDEINSNDNSFPLNENNINDMKVKEISQYSKMSQTSKSPNPRAREYIEINRSQTSADDKPNLHLNQHKDKSITKLDNNRPSTSLKKDFGDNLLIKPKEDENFLENNIGLQDSHKKVDTRNQPGKYYQELMKSLNIKNDIEKCRKLLNKTDHSKKKVNWEETADTVKRVSPDFASKPLAFLIARIDKFKSPLDEE